MELPSPKWSLMIPTDHKADGTIHQRRENPHWTVLYCDKKFQLNIGNALPVGTMPEGTKICCLEEKPGDRV